MYDDNEDFHDRKERYTSNNPQEQESYRDMRAAFTLAEVMDESFDGMTADEYFDIPAPSDRNIMKAVGLTEKQWDSIKVKHRSLLSDYVIGGNLGGDGRVNYFRRELLNIIVACKDKLLESIAQPKVKIAHRRGGGGKGRICTPEQRATMSEGQKKRYARARALRENKQ